MVVGPFNVFPNECSVFLLHHGVVLPHPPDVVDHQTCFSFYYSYFQVLDAVSYIRSEMGLETVALLDSV